MTAQLQDKENQKPQTSKKQEVVWRRQKVYVLYRKGYNQNEIADKLDVSSKTISRDIKELKKDAIEWMNQLPEGDMQLHHKKSIQDIERVINEMWHIMNNSKNESMKIRTLSIIADKIKMRSEMLTGKNARELRDGIKHELMVKKFSSPHH